MQRWESLIEQMMTDFWNKTLKQRYLEDLRLTLNKAIKMCQSKEIIQSRRKVMEDGQCSDIVNM